ncbi:Ureidoglycolate dehydrogenase (NAD(+)) [Lentibacillus sp. JNUCC-1]|uniref:ureidoglycolate dehydrogenase n=1 Tax=Lentibacillus sp. JNUCC-1 TaxID=2654513 RepID=UPI0012E8040F|nr:ureidoglycolate dehydrogenase [Lentibacillus sp. JNUCC-1]MUV38275.1 Ureidoglycolate dehydrogenase (NAD(+)) [Lentibacillus sp. JNUCC-1]
MRVTKDKLKNLIQTKLEQAGLTEEHAGVVADVLVFADAKGIHSHGAMRVEYYAERIAKNGITHNPEFRLEKTGPSSAIYHADNGSGHVACKFAMEEAIQMAKENGVAVVGVKKMSHSGALSYFTEMAAREDLVGFAVCQSDPMVVPFGGAEPYYGTNPLAFAAPGNDGKMISFDMATTVQAWGKILHARSKNEEIPDTWAVDEHGEATTDPHKVKALLPISGPKGYGLGMMIDVLSGVLLGLPFGKKVSSMYHDLSEGRDLGQLHIVINPNAFTSVQTFKDNITQTMQDLNAVKPAKGFDQVYYPGQNYEATEKDYEENGIEIVDDIYDYLVSDVVHNDAYDHQDPFAD